jgi:hypothetical protein
MAGIPSNNYTYLTTSYQSGLQIASGPTTLERITVNTTTATTIGVIDGTSGTTANVATIKSSVAEGTFYYNVRLASGLRIYAPQHLADVTVVWRQ